ncbi:DJ-1/PfpI family protein [Clostridium sp. D2Q-11]|uniref:DJ-1/PfpI family protein n=1 Tax=Anaeromonas frigoriresistens TaxID=2683708 RepID=A0A942USS5_9FIRM|nr:DJ-1/PfpI family protein [Anaeromonas frigoriresistens]MBS4538473.1 DJ-1/PfpI family protein [Anaeromonas frigoriresistens]
MNICILYYDGFCEFEVVISAIQFKDNYFTVALEDKVYISEEKQKFLPDRIIDQLNPEEVDLLIIPGGNPSYLYENLKLKEFIKQIDKKNKYIAGICAGTYLMASYGLLKNKRCTGGSSGVDITREDMSIFNDSIVVQEDVVMDGNMITATGQSFVEFAFELGKLMNVYENDEEAIVDYNWFKNIK